jgi:RNA polymerase sigma factor (TIGR02999 family)
MEAGGEGEVTRILACFGSDRGRAVNELLPLVYDELRKLAQLRLSRESPGQTLQPTALIHEAYLRLVGDGCTSWDNRGHFFAAAAEAMQRILVESARRKGRQRHGGNAVRCELDPEAIPLAAESGEILAVDEALHRMEERDPRMAQVVKLRFFAGLSIEDTARALDVSDRTVRREWTFARAWLSERLRSDLA